MRFDGFEAIGAAVAILVVGPVVWMALDTEPPLRVTGFAPQTAPIERGAPLHPGYRVVYARRCSGENQRVFVDATGHEMRTAPYVFRDGILADGKPVALGVEVEPAVSAPVPYGAAPGPARYQSITRFYCNGLQKTVGRALGLGITFRYPVVAFVVGSGVAAEIRPPTTVFAPDRGGALPNGLANEPPSDAPFPSLPRGGKPK